MSKVYLAIPYSFNPELSYRLANQVAAQLMKEGNVVFSPISHSHPIADYLPEDKRFDHEFWMAQDLPMVDWADKVVVVSIWKDGEDGERLINESKGVMREITYAYSKDKPVETFHIGYKEGVTL